MIRRASSNHRHRFSSFRTFSSFRNDEPPPQKQPNPTNNNTATIIQGPSLLASTGVHRPSPSLFHLPGLRSLPFWTAPDNHSVNSSSISSSSASADPNNNAGQPNQGRRRIAFNDPIITAAIQHVESNYTAIRSEYFSAVLGLSNTETTTAAAPTTTTTIHGDAKILSKPLEPDYDVSTRGGEHAEDALHSGTWDWHSYILNGRKNERFKEKCPTTAQVVDDLDKEGMLFGTPFSFCFFSTLHGQSSIKAHSGPMNLRLRMHLPLIVPSKDKDDSTTAPPPSRSESGSSSQLPKTGIQVADQVREWYEGSAIVLDDSYVHEVWNNTDQSRVLFLLDLWHPDIKMEEREKIAKMFAHAREKGWIK